MLLFLGNWEIVHRLGTRSRTCYNEYALCDPFNTLTTTVRFICVSFRRVNPEERVAGGKNETYVPPGRTHLSQNGNRLKYVRTSRKSKERTPKRVSTVESVKFQIEIF